MSPKSTRKATKGKSVELESPKAKGARSTNNPGLTHSDPEYTSPVYPEPPPPYNGQDYYQDVLAMAQEFAQALELVCVTKTAADTVQQGVKWRCIYIQHKAGKDENPLGSLIFRDRPIPPKMNGQSVTEFCREILIAQVERNVNPVASSSF